MFSNKVLLSKKKNKKMKQNNKIIIKNNKFMEVLLFLINFQIYY